MTTYTVQGPLGWHEHVFRMDNGFAATFLELRAGLQPEGAEVRIDGELVATSETSVRRIAGLDCIEQLWTARGRGIDILPGNKVLRVYASIHAVGTVVDVTP